MSSELTAERLRELLSYDPETGVFRWKVKLANRAPVGSVAGNANRTPWGVYWVVSHQHRGYPAGRLAWLYMTGEWPKEQIDHINRDPSDNRWANLREATCQENLFNKRRYNSTGYIGVQQTRSGWQARLHGSGRGSLGTYPTVEAASWVRDIECRRIRGEFAMLNHPEWLECFTDDYADCHDELRAE